MPEQVTRPVAPAGDELPVVIDTNIVLDLFVFDEPAAVLLRDALDTGAVRWLATNAMRDELARVLGYPQVAKRMQFHGLPPADVLAAFDRYAHIEAAAVKAPFTCGDADDQQFIDLAVAHRATLVSKDGEVLRMKNRLRTLGVVTTSAWAPRFSDGPQTLA